VSLPGKEVSSLKGRGGVSGSIVVGGSYDKPKPLPVFKNRSFCGSRVPNETRLVGREADCGTRLLRSILLIEMLQRSQCHQFSTISNVRLRRIFRSVQSAANYCSRTAIRQCMRAWVTRHCLTSACRLGNKSRNGAPNRPHPRWDRCVGLRLRLGKEAFQ
jgi:hypothetical protein